MRTVGRESVEEEGSGSHVVREAIEVWLDELLLTQKPIVGRLHAVLMKRFVVSTLLTIIAHDLQSGAIGSAEAMQNQFEKLVGSPLVG